MEATGRLLGALVVTAAATVAACGGGGATASVVALAPIPGLGAACRQVPRLLISTFEAEGPSPYSADGCTMTFDALAAQVVTPNGNGWRHELKIPTSLRKGMTQTTESFQADVRVDLSTGGKTIVTQYHAEGTGTIVKVYVSDTDEAGFVNSIAKDGIFDVYVRILPAGRSSEEKTALGTLRSGDRFNVLVKNERGAVTVSAFGRSTVSTVADGGASYLKVGNYLQSQDPVGNVNCSPFAACYAAFGITTARVTMSDVAYSRQ